MNNTILPPRIQPLDPQLVNHIAAGEVIERPAAVLKECLENSFDAGATAIDIKIEKGGLRLIQIRDNGLGVHPDDLLLAVDRHATSKINSLQDLSAITTLGFRGEALASIAAVSRFQLTSRIPDVEMAWQLSVEGGKIAPALPCAHPVGTTVTVADLFFNTPARRRFLRSEKTEYLHIEDVCKRFALASMSVAVNLIHQERVVFACPAIKKMTDQAQRIKLLLGDSFLKNSLVIEYGATQLRLQGYLGHAHYFVNHTDLQYFYINGRMIKDRTISHAIRAAYAAYCPNDKHPAYVLFLTIDPEVVDVNVHPAKHEVRFQDRRLVHDFIRTSIVHALQSGEQPMSMPFILSPGGQQQEQNEPWAINAAPNATHADQQLNGALAPAAAFTSDEDSQPHHALMNRLQPAAVTASITSLSQQTRFQKQEAYASQETQLTETIIGHFSAFLLVQTVDAMGRCLRIIDLQRAKQMIIATELAIKKPAQPLLLPLTVNLTGPCTGLEDKLATFCGHQIDVAQLGYHQLIIRALPTCLRQIDIESLLIHCLQDSDLWRVAAQKQETVIAQRLAQVAVAHWQCPEKLDDLKIIYEQFKKSIKQHQHAELQQAIHSVSATLTVADLARLVVSF